MLEKYIVCNVCGLRSPSFESSSVSYITPTYTTSMQEWVAFTEGFHCILIEIDYIMVFFGREEEDGSLIPPMALTHPLHPMTKQVEE